jgi:mRNA interferase RelE/StbE
VNYRVELRRSAGKALDTIPAHDRQRILETIAALPINPRPPGCKKLSGREGWRVCSQNYRVIYDIDDVKKIVTVLVIGHRKDICR